MFGNLRGQRVAHMLAELDSQGIAIEQFDMIMLDAYVKQEVSGQDLLAHICQFSTLSSYQDWLVASFNRQAGDLKTPASVEQIVAQVDAYIRSKNAAAIVGRSGNLAD